jgi:hypothetical protein
LHTHRNNFLECDFGDGFSVVSVAFSGLYERFRDGALNLAHIERPLGSVTLSNGFDVHNNTYASK